MCSMLLACESPFLRSFGFQPNVSKTALCCFRPVQGEDPRTVDSNPAWQQYAY